MQPVVLDYTSGFGVKNFGTHGGSFRAEVSGLSRSRIEGRNYVLTTSFSTGTILNSDSVFSGTPHYLYRYLYYVY